MLYTAWYTRYIQINKAVLNDLNTVYTAISCLCDEMYVCMCVCVCVCVLYDNITYSMLCAEWNFCDTNVLKVGHICKVVWSLTLHCRPMWIYYGWRKALLLYKYIGLKSLAPINGLTRLLALASCDCLHCKRRFCCELSRRIITNWWRHGRQFRQVWSEERMNFVTTHYSRVKPHSLVVADYWKSVGLA